MSKTFAPILCPVKGNPDISVSYANASCSEFDVFFGLALLEKISARKENPEFKMFLGRLHNMRFSGRELERKFKASRSSIARWGNALKSGDMEKIKVALSGQGAEKKLSKQMVTFMKDQYREIHAHKKNYNQLIRERVKKYHGVSISSEIARQIFAEVRNEVTPKNEDLPLEPNTPNEIFSTPGKSNSCEDGSYSPANGEVLEASRNLSDHPSDESAWFGGVAEGQSIYNHHAGLVLLHHWIEKIISQTGEALDRQMICQILLGAVNHEQAKTLSFSSLKDLIDPVQKSIHYQRSQMDLLATPENTFHLQAQNIRLFQTKENDWFYFDPHSPKYTGALPILKGWCGSTHQVEKVTNMDFIHDVQGNPCYVEHADNYYEMRHRFFTCAANFHQAQLDPDRSICWVIDRGIYSLETLRAIREKGDEIITWEKNYTGNGWNKTAAVGTTAFFIPRNNAKDLRLYKFEYQETEWERDSSFRKIIVRATNPQNRTIEVSILCSDQTLSADKIICAIFRRWLQENDFGYMDRHVGINEMTSRAHQSYGEIAAELTDRPVASRPYKAKKKEKTQLGGKLKTNLLKRTKLVRIHIQKNRHDNEQIEQAEKQIQQHSALPATKPNQQALKIAKAKKTRLEKKRDKNKANRGEATQKLRTLMQEQNRELIEIDHALDTLYRTESRSELLIDENYVRLDFRRKAYMDALRIISRNIFYKLAREFREQYNNHREDHVILRHLTHSAGIISKSGKTIEIALIPSMDILPKSQKIIEGFLETVTCQIRETRPNAAHEIEIKLFDKTKKRLTVLG